MLIVDGRHHIQAVNVAGLAGRRLSGDWASRQYGKRPNRSDLSALCPHRLIEKSGRFAAKPGEHAQLGNSTAFREICSKAATSSDGLSSNTRN